jgi:spermidine/putrescine transport system permease protein
MKKMHLIYLSLIYLLLYLPIAVLAVYSFNDAKYTSTWQGFTWKWYALLFNNEQMVAAAINSLFMALTSASLSVILGLIFSLWVYWRKNNYLNAASFLLYSMIMLPDIILGIGLLIFFVMLQVPLGFFSLLISHIAFELPFVMITLLGRLKTMDQSIIEAAQDLGAETWAVVNKVILPLLMPAIISAWVLSFTLSLDDVIISSFVSGSGFEILPLKIYSMARLGVDPQINALCFILFTMALIAAIIANHNYRRN